MRFLAVLNRGGGTLRTMDIDAFVGRCRDTLEGAGHAVEFSIVNGDGLSEALAQAARAGADVLLAGGGDGTISAAAAVLMGSDTALAVLPAGTMNLFARGLGIPLDLDQAVADFANGEIRSVDIATANGQPFVHQFSIGLHSDLIRRREALNYSSKFGKMRASVVAALATIARPPRLHFELAMPDAAIRATASSLGISNNALAGGPLPVAARLDGGELGIYIARAHRSGEIMRLLLALATGRWNQSSVVEIHRAPNVRLTLSGRSRRIQCAIDGELGRLEARTEIAIHPGALKVLVPRPAAA